MLAEHVNTTTGAFIGTTCPQYASYMTGKVDTQVAHQAFAVTLGLPSEKYAASGNGGYTVASTATIKGNVCGDSDITLGKLEMSVESVITVNVASLAEANAVVKTAKEQSTALNTGGVSDALLGAINAATGLTLSKADIKVEVVTFSVKKGSAAPITDFAALQTAADTEIAAQTTIGAGSSTASAGVATATTKAATAGAFERSAVCALALVVLSSVLTF